MRRFSDAIVMTNKKFSSIYGRFNLRLLNYGGPNNISEVLF